MEKVTMQFQDPHMKHQRSRFSSTILPGVIGAVIGVAGMLVGLHGLNRAEHMAQAQTAATSNVQSMQRQMDMLTQRISMQEAKEREMTSALSAAQNAASQAAAQQQEKPSPTETVAQTSAPVKPRRTTRHAQPKKAVEDPRIQELQRKFDEQARKFSEQDDKLASNERLIESTRTDLQSARTDLENQLTTKSGELAGSIAKTSEEVAALRKRGERDYFEFDLSKSKQLQRVGPLSLALRKADTKHKRYNIDMVVDDNKLEKKNVNLLEPVYITSSDSFHPVELVVNRVDKDHVTGYVSVSKYKRSELTSAEPARSTMTLPAAPTTAPEN